MSENPLFIPRRKKSISETNEENGNYIEKIQKAYSGSREPYENVVIKPPAFSGYRHSYTPHTFPSENTNPLRGDIHPSCEPANHGELGAGQLRRDHYENMEHVYFSGNPRHYPLKQSVRFVPKRDAPHPPALTIQLPSHHIPNPINKSSSYLQQPNFNHLPAAQHISSNNLDPSAQQIPFTNHCPSFLHHSTSHPVMSPQFIPMRGCSTGQETSRYSSYEHTFHQNPVLRDSLPVMSEESSGHYLSPTNYYPSMNNNPHLSLTKLPTLSSHASTPHGYHHTATFPSHATLPSHLTLSKHPTLPLDVSKHAFISNETLLRHYFCLALTTCLICPPCGVWSLHQAFKVDDMVDRGNLIAAEHLAKKIKRYSIVIILAGVLCISIAVVIFVVLFRKSKEL